MAARLQSAVFLFAEKTGNTRKSDIFVMYKTYVFWRCVIKVILTDKQIKSLVDGHQIKIDKTAFRCGAHIRKELDKYLKSSLRKRLHVIELDTESLKMKEKLCFKKKGN